MREGSGERGAVEEGGRTVPIRYATGVKDELWYQRNPSWDRISRYQFTVKKVSGER